MLGATSDTWRGNRVRQDDSAEEGSVDTDQESEFGECKDQLFAAVDQGGVSVPETPPGAQRYRQQGGYGDGSSSQPQYWRSHGHTQGPYRACDRTCPGQEHF